MLAGSLLTFFSGLACKYSGCALGLGYHKEITWGLCGRCGARRGAEEEPAMRHMLTAVRLPNPLLIRGVLVGFTLGAIFSGGLIVQDKMAYSIRQREIADEATAEVLEENPAAVAVPAASTLREGQSEAEKDKEAALVGSTAADATGEMGWMDWALFKTGLSGKKGEESKEKA